MVGEFSADTRLFELFEANGLIYAGLRQSRCQGSGTGIERQSETERFLPDRSLAAF
jgi:hypothetical protein